MSSPAQETSATPPGLYRVGNTSTKENRGRSPIFSTPPSCMRRPASCQGPIISMQVRNEFKARSHVTNSAQEQETYSSSTPKAQFYLGRRGRSTTTTSGGTGSAMSLAPGHDSTMPEREGKDLNPRSRDLLNRWQSADGFNVYGTQMAMLQVSDQSTTC